MGERKNNLSGLDESDTDLRSDQLFGSLKQYGFKFVTGVPDSVFAGFVACARRDEEITYVPAAREEEAVGIAAGAYFGGMRSAVHMENAGLGNSINALLSLILLYRIPVLLVISWRGEGEIDTPEHHIQGAHTLNILNELGIPSKVLTEENHREALGSLIDAMNQNTPVALLIKKGLLS